MKSVTELLKAAKEEQSDERYLQRIHHVLMKEYGWIPLEEFKALPIPTITGLLEEIQFDNEQMEKEMRKRKK